MITINQLVCQRDSIASVIMKGLDATWGYTFWSSMRGSVGLIGYVLDLADMSHISLPVPQAGSSIVSHGRDEKKRTDVE